jgi:hypothetical protein
LSMQMFIFDIYSINRFWTYFMHPRRLERILFSPVQEPEGLEPANLARRG